jgi:hypothetical protein
MGRTLSPLEGCVVQVVALAVFGVLLWMAFASGLVTVIAEAFAKWYASQIHLGPTPTP